MNPLVSCIIPTRNRANLVGTAIRCGLEQTYDAMEVIVVDDGSTDATPSILAEFSGRIRVLRTDALGVAAARNAALAEARGRYVAFLDSDDAWHAEKTAVQVQFMRSHPEVGLSFTDYTVSELAEDGSWRVSATRRFDGDPSLRRLIQKNFAGTLTVMIARETLLSTGGFDTSLERGSDYDLWLRVAARYTLARVPRILADYRWHEESLTRASRVRDVEAYIGVIEKIAISDPGLFELSGTDQSALLEAARARIDALRVSDGEPACD